MEVVSCENIVPYNAPSIIIKAHFLLLDGICVKFIKISMCVGHKTSSSIIEAVQLSVRSCFMHLNIQHLITNSKL